MRTVLSLAVLALAACSPPAETTTTDTTTATETPAPAAPTVIMITEADARSRLEAAGYTDITGLTQNADGTWSATGTKDGQSTTVTISDSGVTVATAPTP